jgi:aspartate/methionine/tyrosine aminotransferase
MLHHRTALSEAARAAAVPPFHAMAMSRAASELEASGRSVLHLEVGQPFTPAPATARRAAIAALETGDSLGYTNAAGLMSLRRRIARHYEEWYSTSVNAENVMIVGGASAGFTLAFAAAFDAGDRVGVLEPGYPCYRNTLLALGIEPVSIAVGHETRWAPTTELLDAAGRLDGLIIASPSNPTGTVLDSETLAATVGWCDANGVQLIADEIYHGLVFEGRAETVMTLTDSAVVINSFSKYFSMTGWRLGWMVVPGHLAAAIERLQQNLYICAPHISQVAGLAAFDGQDELDGHVDRYRSTRAALLSGLTAAGMDDVAAADGAFYVYLDVAHLVDQPGVDDSMTLCRRWLNELGVATTPGLDFDLRRGTHTVRLSYAGSERDVLEACGRIGGWTP